jgi:hypothetical protein
MEIHQRLREAINRAHCLAAVCDTMSVATYQEGMKLLVDALGTPEENPKVWQSIAKPVSNWKSENKLINGEVKQKQMSGDSMVDESNTWWAAIQSTICRNS